MLPLCVSGLSIFFWNKFGTAGKNEHAWFILLYYSVFTFLTHRWMLSNPDPKAFVMRFMGVTGIKLFLNLIIILIYGLSFREKAVSFALFFMSIYFLFTFFESYSLVQEINKTKKNP